MDKTGETLRLEENIAEKLTPAFLSNTLECLLEAARKGRGIIALYDKMTVMQRLDLQNVLPDISIKADPVYFVYPEYLKEDKEIAALKDYLRERIQGG